MIEREREKERRKLQISITHFFQITAFHIFRNTAELMDVNVNVSLFHYRKDN